MPRNRTKQRAAAKQVKSTAHETAGSLSSRIGAALGIHWKLILAGIVVLHVALALLVLQPAPHTGGDNAGYLTLAKSLLERHKYVDLYDPTEPAHTQYPPVYPAILAIALAVGIKPWIQLKLLTVAFSAVAVAFSFLWVRKQHQPEVATGVALLLAVSPGVLGQSFWELSDVPFWAMTMVAVWAWQSLPSSLRGRFIIAVVMSTLAYFTRSAGLPLLIAAFGWLALHKRWKQIAAFAAVILPLALLWYLRARSQGGVDYVSQFWSVNPYNPALGRIGVGDLIERVGQNGWNYLTWHLPMLLIGKIGTAWLSLSIPVVALALYGWIARLRDSGVGELFLPLYLGLILVWPSVWSGERFLLPALPFLLFYAADAAVRLSRRVEWKPARLIPATVAALILVIGVPATARQVRIGSACTSLYLSGDRYACLGPEWKDYITIANIAPRILPKDAAVLSRKARTFYAIGGVRGQQFPLSADPDTFYKTVRETGARYVVLDGLDGLASRYLTPVLMSRPAAFCILFGLGEQRAIVFGIDPTALAPSMTPPQSTAIKSCGVEYWRSAEVRDSLSNGLIGFD